MPGDICAISKVDELHFDAILHASHEEDGVHAPLMDLPQPMTGLALNAKSRSDEQKMAEALDKITAEDPCLTVERNTNTHETIIS